MHLASRSVTLPLSRVWARVVAREDFWELPSRALSRSSSSYMLVSALLTLLSQHQQQLADRIDEVVARVASVEDIAVQARVQSASSQSNTTALACRVRSAETRM